MANNKLASILLGLLPVIMIIRVPFTNFGVATIMVPILAAFALLHLIGNVRKIILDIPILIFYSYIIYKNVGDGIYPVLYLLSLIVALGGINGLFDVDTTIKEIEIIAVFASIIILLQSLFHYAIGINIRTLFNSFLLDEYNKILGYKVSGGIYRPSGIFLEPAHFAQYSIIALLSYMRKVKLQIYRIIIITLAILVSTSGIGLILLVAAYAYFIFIRTRNAEKSQRIKYFVGYGVIIIFVTLLISQISYVRLAMERIISSDSSGYNAIAGRSVNWQFTVDALDRNQLIWGVGTKTNRIYSFMTGLNEIIYYYGYVGLALMILVFIRCLNKQIKKRNWIWVLCFVYIALIVSSDVVGFIMITFWLSILCSNNNNFKEKHS